MPVTSIRSQRKNVLAREIEDKDAENMLLVVGSKFNDVNSTQLGSLFISRVKMRIWVARLTF